MTAINCEILDRPLRKTYEIKYNKYLNNKDVNKNVNDMIRETNLEIQKLTEDDFDILE